MIFYPFSKDKDHTYPLSWITPQLATGHAPMTGAELDSIKKQGIKAILNLCMELEDLVELEKERGFEVYCLPIVNEGFPELAELNKALDWLDESIYLGKKVLVHCRHGIGRTGTVVFSYLLRKGLDTKSAGKKMRNNRARPTEQPQKRFLHLYGKRQKPLKISEPSLIPEFRLELTPYFDKTSILLEKIDKDIPEHTPRCGKDHTECCCGPVRLSLAESVYLQFAVNTELSHELRREVIERALEAESGALATAGKETDCPLLKHNHCLLYDFRPARCRVSDSPNPEIPESHARQLSILSAEILEIFLDENTDRQPPEFYLSDVVSGKFVQKLFHLMTGSG